MSITIDRIILWLPLLSMIAVWLFRQAEQRLPEKQRAALDQFAKYAVKKIEQQYDWSGSKKRAYAETIITTLFEDMHLPVPSFALIDAAIEACVWEIHQSKIPNEFLSPDEKAVNTGPMKPVLPPDPGGQPA